MSATAPAPARKLPAQPETLDKRTVAGDVLLRQVLQQSPAAPHEEQQATAAVVVMLVHLEVLGQVIDPAGQQRNLDFRRTGVTLSGGVLRHDLFLHGVFERHVAPSMYSFGELGTAAYRGQMVPWAAA